MGIKLLKKPVLRHVIIIALFIVYELRMLFLDGTNAGAGDLAIFYAVDMLYFYCSAFWILPDPEDKQPNLLLNSLAAILWMVLVSLLVLFIRNALLRYHGEAIDSDFRVDFYKSFWRRVYLFSLALGYWYARYSIAKEREIYQIGLQVAEANEREARKESALLRSQLNPHLLYNALNHIYSLVEHKVPEAAQSVLLFSDMMSFAIGKAGENSLHTLKDELEQIRRIVKLHRTLQQDRIYINEHIDIPVHTGEIRFPPLLLVNLVENVFKHGQLDAADKAAKIDMRFIDGCLKITIENHTATRLRPEKRTGIGLENTQKRLREHYPGRFSFSAVTVHQKFIVTLTIYL